MTVKLVFPVAENTEITNNGEQRLLRRNKKKKLKDGSISLHTAKVNA